MAKTEDNWRRSTGGRFTRRRLLRTATFGVGGLSAAVLSGCGRGERTAGRPAPGDTSLTKQPKQGGVLVHHATSAISQDVVGAPFDPHAASPKAALTHRLVYQGLLGYDLQDNSIVQPDLAQSWEQPSPTEYIFKLAPGAQWQNKPPVNARALQADDVVFSLERARTDAPQFVSRSSIAMLERIEAPDKGRVRIATKTPDVTTLNALAADPFLILAPEAVEKARRFATPEEVIGTGPFMLKSIEVRVAGEYVRNPDYWKPGLPYLDGVRTQFFPDDETAFAAFLAGSVHVAQASGIQAERFIAQQGPTYAPLWFKVDAIYLAMPNTQARPLDDPRVTRALRLLIDHHEFLSAWVKINFGRGALGSIFPASLDSWDVPQEEYPRLIFWKQPKDEAVREARGLLAAAGYTPASPLQLELFTLASGVVERAAELLQAQWRRLGQGIVSPEIKAYDTATGNAVAARRQFTYGLYPTSAPVPEPGAWLNQLWRTGGSRNFIGFSDRRVDDMIDRQSSLFDPPQRRALVHEIIRYMMENSPGVGVANMFRFNAVDRKVQGFAPEGFLNGRQYEWIWLDT